MKTLITVLPFIAVYLIYRFVHPVAGFIALAVLVGAIVVLKRATILMLRGSSKYNKGDKAGGLALMEKAYKIGGLEANMVTFYAYCLDNEGRSDRAMEVLDEYLASGKGTPADICSVKQNKAAILRRAGKADEAIAIMKEAHEACPSTDTYAALGSAYSAKAKKDPAFLSEVLPFFEEAYDYNEDNRIIADNLGNAYLALGRLDDAENVYKKLLTQKPPTPTPYYRAALVQLAKENYEDAEDYLNQALRHSFAGITAIKREDVTDALEKLSKREVGEE